MLFILGLPVLTGISIGTLYHLFNGWKQDLTHCKYCDHKVAC